MEKALEEGVRFAEGLTPRRGRGRRQSATPRRCEVEGQQGGEKIAATLPARTILVAAGTQPNTVLAREDATHAFLDGKYFQALDEDGRAGDAGARSAKPSDVRVLMHRARRRPLHQSSSATCIRPSPATS